MNLKHYVWLFKGALAPDVCDRIIKTALAKQKKPGQIHSVTLGEAGEYRIREALHAIIQSASSLIPFETQGEQIWPISNPSTEGVSLRRVLR